MTWTDEELEIIESATDYKYHMLLMIAIYTGMRVSEIIGLKWSDFKDDKIYVRRQYSRGVWCKPKGGKERVIPMHEKIKGLVENAERKSELVFTSSVGTPLDYHNLRRSLNIFYIERSLEPKKFHSYRATFCTNLCSKGVPIQIASRIMGHQNINVTAKYYTSIKDNDLLDAINKV